MRAIRPRKNRDESESEETPRERGRGLDRSHNRDDDNNNDHDVWCSGDCYDSDYYSNSEFSYISNSSDEDYGIDGSNIDLQYMLKINDQLNSTNDKDINSVLIQIINNVFGGKQAIIKHIVSNANYEQLQQIYDIITNINCKQTPKQSSKSKNLQRMQQSPMENIIEDTKDNNMKNSASWSVLPKPWPLKFQMTVPKLTRSKTSEHGNNAKFDNKNKGKNKNKNSFDMLCDSNISHICGYLSRKDIKSFKLCSNRMGIISLKEMNKYTVGIFNMNELINNENPSFDIEKNMKYNRYNGNKSLLYLKEAWNKQYKIDEKYQLLFPYNKKKSDNTIIKILDSSYMKFKNKDLNKPFKQITNLCDFGGQRRYLLFDKRNIIKLNEHGIASKYDEHKDDLFDNFELNEKYHLIILRYHDMIKSETNTIQYVMCHNNITYQHILRYLEFGFIATNKMQKRFELSLKMNRSKKAYNISFPEPSNNMKDDGLLCVQYRLSDRVGIPRFFQSKRAKFEWRKVDEKFMDKPVQSLFHYNKCMVIRFMLESIKDFNDNIM